MDSLCLEQKLAKSIDEVWSIITTSEGMCQFFAPQVSMDLSIDGLLDVWFFPDNPAGLKGAEGMRILAFEAPRRLLFSWNQPPFLASIQNQRTVVEWLLEEQQGETTLKLTQMGWGQGGEWPQAKAYFTEAWKVVLNRLAEVCEGKSIDWSVLSKE